MWTAGTPRPGGAHRCQFIVIALVRDGEDRLGTAVLGTNPTAPSEKTEVRDVRRTLCKRPLLVRGGELHHSRDADPYGPMSVQGLSACIRYGPHGVSFL